MSSAGYVGTYSEENFVAGLCYSYASYASIDTTFVDMPFPEPDSVDYNRWIVSKNVDCKLETIWNHNTSVKIYRTKKLNNGSRVTGSAI